MLPLASVTLAPLSVLLPLRFFTAPSVPPTPLPFSVGASATVIALPPLSCCRASVAPAATVVPPVAVPKAALFAATRVPALIVVGPL